MVVVVVVMELMEGDFLLLIEGAQTSAAALTWSYANILHSLHARKNVVKLLETIRP